MTNSLKDDPGNYTLGGIERESADQKEPYAYAPIYASKAVEEQAAMLMEYPNLLITQLKAAMQKTPMQDMMAWYNVTTFDLTGDFAFGGGFHCLDRSGKYCFFVKTVSDGVIAGLQMQQLEWYEIDVPQASVTEAIDEAEGGHGSIYQEFC
ncbi:hypothetical protein B7463_g214, partial [Scytalidium lignicola]